MCCIRFIKSSVFMPCSWRKNLILSKFLNGPSQIHNKGLPLFKLSTNFDEMTVNHYCLWLNHVQCHLILIESLPCVILGTHKINYLILPSSIILKLSHSNFSNCCSNCLAYTQSFILLLPDKIPEALTLCLP